MPGIVCRVSESQESKMSRENPRITCMYVLLLLLANTTLAGGMLKCSQFLDCLIPLHAGLVD